MTCLRPCLRLLLRPVVVTQVALRVDLVTYALLEHLGLRETAIGLALPDLHTVAGDVEDSAGAGHQGDFTQIVTEGAEQLLGQPGGAQQPLALGAIGDDNFRFQCGHGG